jgi:hypothetical protein
VRRLDHPEVTRAKQRETAAELIAAGIIVLASLVVATMVQDCAGNIPNVTEEP